MSSVEHNIKHAIETALTEHERKQNTGHPLNPNTVLTPIMTHATDIFNNGPIHLRAGEDGLKEDTYLDWSEPMTLLFANTRDLNEGFLHRDPNLVRRSLFQAVANIEALKTYLVAQNVIDAPEKVES